MEIYLINFLTLVFETSKILICYKLIFNYSIKSKKALNIITALLVLLVCSAFHTGIETALFPLMVLLLFTESSNLVWKWLFTYLLVQSVDSMTHTIFCSIVDDFELYSRSSVFACVFHFILDMLFLCCIMMTFLVSTKKYKDSGFGENKRNVIKLIIVGIIIFFIVTGARAIVELDLNRKVRSLFAIIIMLVAVLSLILIQIQNLVFDSQMHYMEKSETAELLRKKEEKYFAEKLEYYKHFSEFRHNVRYQLNLIQYNRESKPTEGIKTVIENIEKELEKDTIYDTGNVVLDALFTEYSNMCAKQDIGFETEGHLYHETVFDMIDLSNVVGNLLNNAYEECLRQNEHSWIKVSIKYLGKFYILSFENSCISESMESLKTKKRDKANHGIGINTIRKTVEKYEGAYFEWNCKNHIFVANVCLPMR